MTKAFIKALVLAALIAAPLSASARVPAFEPASYHNWSGVYIGAHLGLGLSQFDHDSVVISPSGNTATANIGGQVGYNYQVGQNVFGIEVDGSILNLDDDFVNFTGNHFSQDWQTTIRGRYGYAMGYWLPYVTAGVAITGSTAKIDGVGEANATTAGFALGGGVDIAFGGPWSGRAEFLVTGFPSTDYNVGGTAMKMESTNESFRLGINYSLGNLLK
jgi:outer membrane immunogenic protein